MALAAEDIFGDLLSAPYTHHPAYDTVPFQTAGDLCTTQGGQSVLGQYFRIKPLMSLLKYRIQCLNILNLDYVNHFKVYVDLLYCAL